MKLATLRIPTRLVALFIALMASAGSAWADDYADVAALQRQGKVQAALTKADAYIATKPRDPQMRFMRAVLLTDLGKTDDAIAALIQLSQDYPELPEPHNNLAALYAARGDYDKARGELEQAIRLKPDYAAAHENLGDVYTRLAAQQYAKAQTLTPAGKTVAPKLALLRQLFETTQASAPASVPAAPARRTVGK